MEIISNKESEVKVTQLCPTLQPHDLYSPWNSPGQNPGVGSLSLLQGIFQTQGLNPGHRVGHDWSNLAAAVAAPALQVDSLPAEPQGKPNVSFSFMSDSL